MRKWLGIGIGAVLLSAWLASPVFAAGSCFGTSAADGTCRGVWVGRDVANRGYIYIGDGTNREYVWRSNRTDTTGPAAYVNQLLVSHHGTVESGLSSRQIRNGDVTLSDSMGVVLGGSGR